MRSKLGYGALGITIAFLVATNPVVVNAAGQITSGQIKNETIKSKDIKNGQVQSVDVKDGSLTPGDLADGSLGTGDLTPAALTELKQPRAYGVFTAAGVLVAARSKNVTVSKEPVDLGEYCVFPTAASGVDPTKTTIVATPDFTSGNGLHHIVQVIQGTEAGQPGDCPGGFKLVTDNSSGGTLTRTDIGVHFVIP